jgi:BirA family biotin operon repressor/biotin-[acetyl-CoA-carboxylase] ligase
MDVASREGRSGASEWLVVLAERQLAGRGRQGRSWESTPNCGLSLSILLRPRWSLEEFPRLTLLMSLAAAEAMESLTSLSVGIKWPNDLMIQRKKVGGILTEVQLDASQQNFAVVGLGLNINQELNDFSPEIQNKATSLYLESETRWRRAEVLLALLSAIERRFKDPFEKIREAWIQKCVTLGEYVTLQTPQGVRQGHAIGVQNDGTLLLRTEGGTIEVITSGLVE